MRKTRLGIIRQPKWGHLKDLHKAIKLCEEALLTGNPKNTSLGQNLEAHVYQTASGNCAAFLANNGNQSSATVTFNGRCYNLPAWSVSILPDCQNVAFNAAQINSQATTVEALYLTAKAQTSDKYIASSITSLSDWTFFNEPVGISKNNAFKKMGLLEQINTTAISSDYLWYSISIDVNGDESFLNSMMQSNFHVESLGHVLHVFVNGNYVGNAIGKNLTFENPIILTPGTNKIDLLSATVGLGNYGAFFDLAGAEITGPVHLRGQNGALCLSYKEWTYQIGLKGEDLGLFSSVDSSKWISLPSIPKNQPLVWYKAGFNAPDGNDPIAIDFTGMGKGEAWVNGQSIGRYWPTNIAPEDGCNICSYKGVYEPEKCQKNCGKPSQRLYHLPRSMVLPGSNTLVLFEEMGGNPEQISFAIKKVTSICGHVSESHPAPLLEFNQPFKKENMNSTATLFLECPYPNQVISSINFASFGTPSGKCGDFSHGQCISSRAHDIVEQACLGLKSCSISVSANIFGGQCNEVIQSLAVEAACT